LGNDQFLHPNAPDHLVAYTHGETDPTPVEGWLAVFRDGQFVDLQVGPLGVRWLRGMFFAMAGWSQAGNHLIADVVLHDDRIWQAAAEAFHPLPAWLISVYCPLAVAEQREHERAERRAPGGARVFYEAVYKQDVYDLRVDTALSGPDVCAAQIRHYLQAGHPPTAFRQLRQRFSAAP
jgi:chloramphenicol 3-O phosphotransferase